MTEFNDSVVLDQTHTIFGEDRWHSHGIVHGQAGDPAKQKLVLRLLHELVLRADAAKHRQEHGA